MGQTSVYWEYEEPSRRVRGSREVSSVKFGVRKPSLTRSFKARTTGRWKRAMKRSINPFYGKRGMGWLHPKRAMYNRIYHRTTVSVWDLFKVAGSSHKRRRSASRSRAAAVPAIDWNLVKADVERREQLLSPAQQQAVETQYAAQALDRQKVLCFWLLTGIVGGHRFNLHENFQADCMIIAMFFLHWYALAWWVLDFLLVNNRVTRANILLKRSLVQEQEDQLLSTLFEPAPPAVSPPVSASEPAAEPTMDELDEAVDEAVAKPVEVMAIERFYPPDTEKFAMNDGERTFFRTLFLQLAAAGYGPRVAVNRLSDGTLNFCYDGKQIGRVRLQKRKHTMQILTSDDVELLEGELPLFLDNIPRWLDYLKTMELP